MVDRLTVEQIRDDSPSLSATIVHNFHFKRLSENVAHVRETVKHKCTENLSDETELIL